MTDLRACPVKGCGNRHRRSMMMCRSHWFSLPKPMRDEVYRAVKLGVFTDEYMEIRQAAIRHAGGEDD